MKDIANPLIIGELLVLLLLLLATPALADTVQPSRIVIVDGDTLAIGRERIRLLDIDAPESFRSRCEAELVVGLRAKQRLAELLRAGPVEVEHQQVCTRSLPPLCRTKTDRYRRSLARIKDAAGRDVGTVLLSEGLAVPYRPGRDAWEERRAHWCGGAE